MKRASVEVLFEANSRERACDEIIEAKMSEEMDTAPDVSADRVRTPVEPMEDFPVIVVRAGTVTGCMLCWEREAILVRDQMGQAQWIWITDMLDGAQNGGISDTCRVNIRRMQSSIYPVEVLVFHVPLVDVDVDGDGDGDGDVDMSGT